MIESYALDRSTITADIADEKDLRFDDYFLYFINTMMRFINFFLKVFFFFRLIIIFKNVFFYYDIYIYVARAPPAQLSCSAGFARALCVTMAFF